VPSRDCPFSPFDRCRAGRTVRSRSDRAHAGEGDGRGERRSLLTTTCVCVCACVCACVDPHNSLRVRGCGCLCVGLMNVRRSDRPCRDGAVSRGSRRPSLPVRSPSRTRVPCGVLCEYSVRAAEAVGERSLPVPVRSPSPTRLPCGVLCEYSVGAAEAVGERSLLSPSAPLRVLEYPVGYSVSTLCVLRRQSGGTRCRPLPFAYSGTLWGTL
jgi:hypothetical protein